MESPAATSSRKRKSHQATLDDLEAEMAALGRETQLMSQISDNKYSDDIMHSYLNRQSQLTQETENELITMIHKAILEEKSCPTILPFQTELYQNLSEVLLNRDEDIKQSKLTLNNKMFLNIYALEVERTKYMLKVYLRIRLFKIQKYAIYILRNKQEGLLSPQENTFLKQFFELKQTHFNENILSHVPNTLRNLGLDAKYEKPNNEYMVPEPDLEKTVLVRVIKGYEKFTLDVNNSQELNLVPGDIFCFKYKDIKNLHQKGMVEFI